MKPFLTTKRSTIEIGALFIVDVILYFLGISFEFIILFSLGFIWNWVASQNLELLFQNHRYRYSMIKLVVNLQNLIKMPLKTFPLWLSWVAGIFPAGIFWSMVIFFNDSDMPWWATFMGSFVFELSQINFLSLKKAV
ncbi:MAG: hypothetical protein AB7I27_05355 [Bacteriovoracaceae bacterium]